MAPRFRRLPRLGGLLAALGLAATLMSGCGTHPPLPITASINRQELVQAEFFPYYRVYWDGLRFQGLTLTAADGVQNYNPSIGESLQYGNCGPGKGPLHTGGCILPLQVTTVIWHHHSNAGLGTQSNMILRGVPATVFNGGRSIEVYTGKQAIDVVADTPARALAAARALRPLNAPGSAQGPLPLPDYCPEVVGRSPHLPVQRTRQGRLDCIDVLSVS
jgi:hypothetical protein